MAVITPGSGGSVKSSTVEGQLFELAQFIVNAEADAVKNPGELDYFQVDASDDMRRVSIRYNFPVQANSATGGGYNYGAAEYLTDPGFSAGSGGTINDDSTIGYWKRLVEHAQELEAPLQPTVDEINGTLRINDKTFSGEVNLTIEPTIQGDGSIQLAAVEYL